MNKLFFLLVLWFTKFVNFFIRFFHLGQGSNFAGKIALKINKDLLNNFTYKENSKIIFLTGTNGKSTTCGLLANVLKTAGYKIIYNKSGANLLSGITTTLCFYSDLTGKINYDFIILEVDEASLQHLTKYIKPNLIAVTNLFRDQLDRFGELDTTAKLIEKGISNAKNATVVLNADDPRVAFLNIENKKTYYGISTIKDLNEPLLYPPPKTNNDWLSDPEEATTCPKCNSNFVFHEKFLAHLGHYSCPKCKIKRPDIDFLAHNFKTDNLSTYFDIKSPLFKIQKQNFFLPLIGMFNVYNALCTIAVSKTISDITPLQIQKGFQSYSTIFGRAEKIEINKKTAWIYLIKNPTGTTEVLKTLSNIPNSRFLIALNDNFADGRDVSWIWDARFDLLSSHQKDIFVSGKRAYDIGLRLKYANINSNKIQIIENIEKALINASKKIEDNETLYILPTYTCLLEMQRKRLCKGEPL